MAEFLRRWRFASGGFRVGIVVVAAAIVFATLVLISALTFVPALVGFGFLSLASLIAGDIEKDEPLASNRDKPSDSHSISILESAISGLPDAVVALSRRGRVLAFNAQAAQLAPGLRRGELGLI